MNSPSSPTRVTPPPPSVPVFMVTCSRMRLCAPITSRVASPRYLRSCGISPMHENGKTTVPSPISVAPLTTTWDLSVTPGASRTCGPTWQNGPIRQPSPISAPGSTTAAGWIMVSLALSLMRSILRHVHHGGEFRLGGNLVAHPCHAREFPDLAAGLAAVRLDGKLQHVAGHHHAAELGALDGHEIDQHVAILQPQRAAHHHRGGLRHRLDDGHA